MWTAEQEDETEPLSGIQLHELCQDQMGDEQDADLYTVHQHRFKGGLGSGQSPEQVGKTQHRCGKYSEQGLAYIVFGV